MISRIFSPNKFTNLLRKVRKPLILLTIILFISGMYFSLLASPEDYQQGEMVRIMYIHVPSAWLSLMIYMFIGAASFACLVFKARFGIYLSIAAAPLGTAFTAITLITGMIWGKPIWGTWWVWDARLTSMLILLIFYFTFLAVVSGSDNISRIEKPACAIAIIGCINVPIVKFSVNLWNSLHQPASIIRMGAPTIDKSMLLPLFIMFLANFLLFVILLSIRTETLLKRNVLRSN